MKISVIGSGAMGSLFGGKLSLSGFDVVLYDINRIHIERILLNGLEIEEPSTGEILKAYPMATSNQQDVEGSDLETLTYFFSSDLAKFTGTGNFAIDIQTDAINTEYGFGGASNVTIDATTDAVVALPTPSAPPFT